MAEKTLNKLKNTALNYASTALLRVELAAEESKLKKRFQALGQKLHGAIRDAYEDRLEKALEAKADEIRRYFKMILGK